MSAFNKFQAFVAAAANGLHNLGTHQLRVAITNTAPTAANALLADLTGVLDASNLDGATPFNVTTVSSSQAGGVYKLILSDLLLEPTGTKGPFRYVVLYNDTASGKPLIGWWDRGSSITLEASDTGFLIEFDGTDGVIQIT